MPSKEKHILIVYPGLSDGVGFVSTVTKSWKKRYGVRAYVTSVPWNVVSEGLDSKLERAVRLVDQLSQQADLISLLGISGGGSFTLNVFAERLNTIHKVVSVCGRMRAGEDVVPTLDQASAGRQSFRDSVLLAEQNASIMSPDALARVMTIRPKYGDEVVPVSTVPLQGGHNATVPTLEHMISIGHCLLFPKNIISFLLDDSD